MSEVLTWDQWCERENKLNQLEVLAMAKKKEKWTEVKGKSKPKGKGGDEWVKYDIDFPDPWTPKKKGDSLIGVIGSMKTIQTTRKKGKKSTTEDVRIITLKTDEGSLVALFESARLKSMFDHHKTLHGHRVKIVYNGMATIKGGRKLKQYEVYFDPKGAQALQKVLDKVPF